MLYNGLKTYGKDPGQLDATIDLFMFALAEYPADLIGNAFKKYVSTNSDFPAPADIAQLIERQGRPKLENSVYISISKKPADTRTDDEWQYMREYEHYMVKGDGF